MIKVRAKYLLLIAAFVWFAAGANIFAIGIQAWVQTDVSFWLLLLGEIVVFFLFHPMFSKLVGKHSDRIRSYGEEKVHALKFFDIKSYIMMAIMMTMGISLRAWGLVPLWFIAFFYTAVGFSLMLAGVGFLIHYIKRGGTITCPVTKKSRLA